MFLKVTKKQFLLVIKSRLFDLDFGVGKLSDGVTYHIGKYIYNKTICAFEVFRFSDGRRNEYYVKSLFSDDDDMTSYTEYAL